MPKSVKNLVIVESPAKAKTIEKFLGKEYVVKSTFGHIRDLDNKPSDDQIVNGIKKDFTPLYKNISDKRSTITDLKKFAKNAIVWLASDEDREGEAIAWHTCEVLGLDPEMTKRITFHEITKNAIVKAIENPRKINIDLVNAQQARRTLDRLVGFELSPVLWSKIRGKLSAGRVQSVAVRLIVDREEEIKNFQAASSLVTSGTFQIQKTEILAKMNKKFEQKKEAKNFIDSLIGAKFNIENIEKKSAKKSPSLPFTTSTLQQEASTKLSMSVKQTMMMAQRLYEKGHITYMRTDSVNLSNEALASAAEVIKKNFGENYHQMRKFQTKSKGAQEAHEAIRPTHFEKKTIEGEHNEQRLYELIWKRTLASQMAETKIEKTLLHIANNKNKEIFIAEGEVVIFDGFLKLTIDEGKSFDSLLPKVEKGQEITALKIQSKETFQNPPARYTEASLVKKLESEGIGRPSTYAPTISTIQDRSYVEKTDRPPRQREVHLIALEKDKVSEKVIEENTGAEKNKLFPTNIGKVVNDFLVKNFAKILDYQFTANIEKEFDEISNGKVEWKKMLKNFYDPFHNLIEEAKDIDRSSVVQSRILGEDPKTKKEVLVRIGKFGPLVQIGTTKGEEKPSFASVPEELSLEDITLKQALNLFQKKQPNLIGKTTKGEEIMLMNGRFGYYIKVGDMNISLTKHFKENPPETDPPTLTQKTAIELIKAKEKSDAEKFIQVWKKEGIELLRGPYGIYIKTKEKGNVRIPKEQKDNAEKLTLKECQDIIKKAPKKSGGRKFFGGRGKN